MITGLAKLLPWRDITIVRTATQGWGQVHRYLYLPVLKYIFLSNCLYFVLELQKCTCTCTCTQVHYEVLGTWKQVAYIASTSRFVSKNICYNLLFQLFSAIFFRIQILK